MGFMNGKSKCKVLKDIRKKIAEANDIAYITSECKYQGDCSGTCPKCEAEVRYLEEELAKRKNLGKIVAVAGIAATLVVASAGCDLTIPNQTAGAPLSQETTYQTQPATTQPSTTEPVPGEVPVDETTQPFDDVLFGEPVLMGDMPLPEDYQSWD
jgi:hypothetical protein